MLPKLECAHKLGHPILLLIHSRCTDTLLAVFASYFGRKVSPAPRSNSPGPRVRDVRYDQVDVFRGCKCGSDSM